MKNKARAWFIRDDGRAPQTLYVMYDHRSCGSKVRFIQGKELDLEEIGSQKFNVEDNKWGKLEHILKWDFLPNSTGIPLANEKALKVLEEVAQGEFQAIPTAIKLPDGQIIKEYKLINVINKIDSVDYHKSILKPENKREEWDMYEKFYHKLGCLGDFNLGRSIELPLLGSEKLRDLVRSNKLQGLTFTDRIGYTHYFLEE